MSKRPKIERRVVMARKVAHRWVSSRSQSEHRFKVYCESKKMRMPDLLRSFRDGRVKLGEVQPLSDLGVKDHGGSISLWSQDRKALVTLQTWLEKKGLETTGVW